MANHIVLEPAPKIRQIARDALANNWIKIFIGLLIYYILVDATSTVLDSIFYYVRSDEMATIFSQALSDVDYRQIFGQPLKVKVGYGGNLYLFVVAGPMMYGITLFVLAFFRQREVKYSSIFEGFSHFFKAFLLHLLISIKIFLWTLLFIVPGIIAAIRYSQSYYVLIDHPEYSVIQCIRESKRLMLGNKGSYFYLQLTFIGWYILALLPVILFNPIKTAYNPEALNIAIDLILGIPQLFVVLYAKISNTTFYDLLTERLVVLRERPSQENPFADMMQKDTPEDRGL